MCVKKFSPWLFRQATPREKREAAPGIFGCGAPLLGNTDEGRKAGLKRAPGIKPKSVRAFLFATRRVGKNYRVNKRIERQDDQV